MGLTTSELNVKIKADTSDLKRGASEAKEAVKSLGTESEKSAGKLGQLDSESLLAGSSLVNLAQAAIGAFQKIKNAIGSFVEAGSDAVETQNVVNVAFGESVAEINEWSEGLIEAYGLSATMAKSFAGTFKVMGTSMGLASDSASDMAVTLTELSADMASFYNASATETFQALEGIYTGSTESLRKYGIVLNQSTQEQWMLEHGIKASYEELSEAEKVAIRFGAVMDATAQAQGDFSRSTESWSAQTKQLKSNWQEIKETIGNALASVLLPFVELFNALLKGIQKLINYTRQYDWYTLPDGTPMVREKSVTEEDAGIDIPEINAEAFNGYQEMAVTAYEAAAAEREALFGVSDAAADTSAKFKKATTTTKKYNDTTKDTQKSVKALKRDLLSFDELNKLSDPYSGFGSSISTDKANDSRDALTRLRDAWTDLKNTIKESPKYEAFKTAMTKVKNSVEETKEKFQPFVTKFKSVKDSIGEKLKTTFGNTPIGKAFTDLKKAAGTTCVNAITKLQDKMGGITFNGKNFPDTKLGKALEALKQKISAKNGANDAIDSLNGKISGITFGGKTFSDTKLGKALAALRDKITGSGGVNPAISDLTKSLDAVKNEAIEKAPDFGSSKFGKFLAVARTGFSDTKKSVEQSTDAIKAFYKKLENPPKLPTIVNDVSKLPTVIKPSAFADGGYPQTGSLFLAGEAGPEFVGNVGGKTGVWNSDQLINGIYNAMTRALSEAGINATINLDGRPVYKSVIRNDASYRLATGRA